MDEDIKKRFDRFCSDAGMNASVAVNMFARAVLRENRIPFEIRSYMCPDREAAMQTLVSEELAQPERHREMVHELQEIYKCNPARKNDVVPGNEESERQRRIFAEFFASLRSDHEELSLSFDQEMSAGIILQEYDWS
jgi:DNA-damage-inducible protein J